MTEVVVRGRHASHQQDPYRHKWAVLAAVCIALFMALLDGSIVNVAIPNIAKGLDASFSQIEWVLNAYTLVFASLLVTFGRLGDMFGRKRFFIVGLSVFGLGSLLCGLSATPTLLIASRVLQAAGAAFMMPATLSLTAVNFPPEQRGMAMGIWGAVTGVATAVGPSLGGWITELASWNYIFFINVPIVLVAVPFALWAIPESRDERPHTVDWLGAALSIVTLASLSYGLIEGPGKGWDSPEVLGLFAAAVVGLLAFLLWERRATEPIMDLKLFKSPAFTAGNASGAILMFGMMGMFFLLPIYMQVNLGYDAIKTGFALTPMSGAILFAAPLSGRLSDKIGSRWLVFAGMLTAAAAVFWLSFMPYDSGWQFLVGPLVVAGVGMGLVMAPMTSAVMAVAPRGEEGAASGVLSTMRQLGGLFGVAVLGALFQTAMVASLVAGLQDVTVLPQAARNELAASIEASGSSIMGRESGASMDDMRAMLPTESVLPIIETAVTDAAEKTLPEAMRASVVETVMREVEAGTPLTPEAMMDKLASSVASPAGVAPTGMPEGASGAPTATAPPTGMPPAGMPAGAAGAPAGMPDMASAFADFGAAVAENIESSFTRVGESMERQVSESFVDSMRTVFRLASFVLALGAFLALLLKPGRNSGGDDTVVAVH